jgi:hypothetical protein
MLEMIKHLWVVIFLLLSIAACLPGGKPAVNLEEVPGRVELFGSGWISTSMPERDLAVARESGPGKEDIYMSPYQASKAAKFISVAQFIQAAQSIESGLDNIYRIPFTAIHLPDNNPHNSINL